MTYKPPQLNRGGFVLFVSCQPVRYNNTMLQAFLPLATGTSSLFSGETLAQLLPLMLTMGWLILVTLLMWIVWTIYLLLKRIDFFSSIQWVIFEVSVPPDSEETPKSMENFFEVIGGMHKSPDMTELYFDGMMESWISCEIFCTQGQARYFIVCPAQFRQLIEGTLYAHYPRAEIREAEDYTQRYKWTDIRKNIDIFGVEIIPVEDDIYPIRTYLEFETSLAEEDRYVDPHQAIIEAFTNVSPGEEFWVQVLVRPVDAGQINKWAQRGQQAVAEISGQAAETGPGIFGQLKDWALALPGDLLNAALAGPLEPGDNKEEQQFRFFNPVDEAKMKSILLKTSRTGFRTKIRVMHIAPAGQLKKPNIGRAIGVFKQFNTFHLNSLKPDSTTKSNGPNYVMRETRRYLRERKIFLQFFWRELWYGDGKMFNAEELATMYHLPSKYVKTPGLTRAKSGLQAPPKDLPYAN